MISPNPTAASFSQEPPTGASSADHPQAMPPGSVIGDYEVVKVLGQGGFGIVYLAKDSVLDRSVAIKEFLPVTLAARAQGLQVQARSPAAERRFLAGLRAFVQEARLLAKFDHPALVNIHRFWEANGTAYMVMPYYEGRTLLEARRAMDRPPTEEWLRATLVSLLGGLDLVHKASFVHRDISPENILILDDGRAVLLDFAVLPSEAGDDSGENTTILKPAWAPIEQFANTKSLPQGPWTDIYSLGAVAYFCVTGRAPPAATVRVVGESGPSTPLAEALPRLMAAFPGLQYNPFLVSAIDWALSVRPADRPQAALEWSRALSKVKASPSATVSPISPGIRIEFPDSEPPAAGAQVPRGSSAVGMTPSGERGAAATAAAAMGASGGPRATAGTEPSMAASPPAKAQIDSSIRDAIGAALSGFESMVAVPGTPAGGGTPSAPSMGGGLPPDMSLGAASGVAPPSVRREPRMAPTAGSAGGGSARRAGAASFRRSSTVATASMTKWWIGLGVFLVAVGGWLMLRGGSEVQDELDGPVSASATATAPSASGTPQTTSAAPASGTASQSALLPPLVKDGGAVNGASIKDGKGGSAAISTGDSASPSKASSGSGSSANGGDSPGSIDSRVEDALRQADALKTEAHRPAAASPPKKPAVAEAPPRKKVERPAAATTPTATLPQDGRGEDVATDAEEATPAAAEKSQSGGGSVASPRAACGGRTNFALLRCMQSQCQTGRFVLHPQCSRLRATGEVD